jgi:hypothetical protein
MLRRLSAFKLCLMFEDKQDFLCDHHSEASKIKKNLNNKKLDFPS